jgi:uncharacterized OB-fold protein
MKLPQVELGLRRPLPIEVTAVTLPFWKSLESGQFCVPRCKHCDRLSFPPRKICPQCHGDKFDWQPLSGRGLLYSATKVHSSPSIYGILSPVRVAIVDLEEGLRLLTRWLPSGADPCLDCPVQLVITRHPDGHHYAAREARTHT